YVVVVGVGRHVDVRVRRPADRLAGGQVRTTARAGTGDRVAGDRLVARGVVRLDVVRDRCRVRLVVGVRQRRRRRDRRTVAEDVVPGDADVVGRGSPGEPDLAGLRLRVRQVARRGRCLRVPGLAGTRDAVAVTRLVPGRVVGPDDVRDRRALRLRV